MSWGAPAHVWTKLKAALGRGPKDTLPAPETTTFEYPTVSPRTGTVTTTVHTQSVLTERVECSISPTPAHDIKIVIVDNVVKAVSSPCDRVSALTAAQLGGKSCALRYQEIRAWLRGEPRQWSNIDTRDSLRGPIEEAQHRRIKRNQLRALPTSERVPPSIWAAFIRQTTGLIAQVVVEGSARVYIETPGAISKYSLIGNGSVVDPHMWALGNGPGDQRVYDLLNKYIKLNSKLVKYL